jgi:ABC-type methionine transport system ATPase subunit
VCDEPTSALDPVIAASLLDLLNRLRESEDLAIVLITHELYNLGRVATGVLEVTNRTLAPLTAEQLTRRISARERNTLA